MRIHSKYLSMKLTASLSLLSIGLAAPSINCDQVRPDCVNVECSASQVCRIVPATPKECSKTICMDETPLFKRTSPCPRVKLECNNCALNEECVFTQELNVQCPKPACTKIQPIRANLRNAMVCPEHFARLCKFLECPAGEECIETTQTAFSCSRAVCSPQKLVCPANVAPLCFSHKCGDKQVCIETPRTATQCPKAKCVEPQL